jgi:hypothetical protein
VHLFLSSTLFLMYFGNCLFALGFLLVFSVGFVFVNDNLCLIFCFCS